jgi:hypothetical protein
MLNGEKKSNQACHQKFFLTFISIFPMFLLASNKCGIGKKEEKIIYLFVAHWYWEKFA